MIDDGSKRMTMESILQQIKQEADAKKTDGPRHSRMNSMTQKTPKTSLRISVKQETSLFRFVKKVQQKIGKYPFIYSVAYRTALIFKQYIPKYDERVEIEKFFQYHDEEFIRNAYRGILGREPDLQGFHVFSTKLRNGRLSKTEILGRLRYSKEGKENKVRIRGLFLRYVVASSYRIPVLGYVLSMFSTVARLPRIMRNSQEFEAFTNARFTQHAETFGSLASNVESVAHDVRLIAAEARRTSTQVARNTVDIGRNAADIGRNTADIGRNTADIGRNTADMDKIASDLNRAAAETHGRFLDMASRLAGLQDSKAENRAVDALVKQSQVNRTDILNLQNNLRHIFEELRIQLAGTFSAGQIQALKKEEDHILDSLYVAFEDRFRGTREVVKERTRIYLPFIERIKAGINDATVLDIGCGRGEWLELLRENGFNAKGIDLNRIMVSECRKLGLEVVDDDALRYLKKQRSDAFAVVTGLHIVEHLPLPDLVAMLDEIYRTLKPGGLAIFETPNPENMMVGATFFHIDPTHDKPLHPLTMEFLLGQRGFSKTEILRLHAMPQQSIENDMLHNLLFGPQDYAAMGYKA